MLMSQCTCIVLSGLFLTVVVAVSSASPVSSAFVVPKHTTRTGTNLEQNPRNIHLGGRVIGTMFSHEPSAIVTKKNIRFADSILMTGCESSAMATIMAAASIELDPEERKEKPPLRKIEKAWRYAAKPLLRIGAKGATHSHGNSLRQLLDQHTVVKVKVNTKAFGTLENAFERLKTLAEDAGADPGVELIIIRPSDNIVLFGKPGTLDLIGRGEFPPSSSSDHPVSTE